LDAEPYPGFDEIAARLAAIVQSSDDAIVSKTFEGVITSWNPAAERMFGWTAAEAIGRHITLIIPTDRLAEEDEVLARIRRGDGVDHFETVRITKAGELIHISLTVSPIRDRTGRVVGASKIARDISDRKRADAERIVLLARAQAAQADAEAASRTKDEFLTVLSHELRTPLNAIFGWARMLEGGGLDPAMTTRAVDAIRRNAEAQVKLIEDLLDVSRIITGNLRLDIRPVTLPVVIEAALDATRPAAVTKGVELEVDLDASVPPIMGAADRIQQVAWNLLINAVKFTPRGGRVRVSVERTDADALIVVSDTGQGIARDLLPFVFERFRQGEVGTTRTHGGLGIGLALVRHLVDLHGGSVSAESPGPGLGSTFTVRLPLPTGRVERPAAPLAVLLPAGGRVAPSVAPPSLRGLGVLLVDDDQDGLELASVILTNAGAGVRACGSPAAAHEALAAWTPDVAVLDIEMPGQDGFTLLRRLRALTNGRGTAMPALALTAYGRPADRKRALAAGFNLHLAKPVDPTELILAVASLAGRSD
jgi:PAS domain S-box-containing protein